MSKTEKDINIYSKNKDIKTIPSAKRMEKISGMFDTSTLGLGLFMAPSQ